MKRALIPFAAAALLAAPGCGEDKTTANNKYVDQVNSAQQRIAESVAPLGKANASPTQISKALDQLRAAVTMTATEIKAIEPPGDARPAHDKLVASLEGYAGALKAAAAGLRSRDPAKQARAGQAVITATAKAQADFDAAKNEINSRLGA